MVRKIIPITYYGSPTKICCVLFLSHAKSVLGTSIAFSFVASVLDVQMNTGIVPLWATFPAAMVHEFSVRFLEGSRCMFNSWCFENCYDFNERHTAVIVRRGLVGANSSDNSGRFGGWPSLSLPYSPFCLGFWVNLAARLSVEVAQSPSKLITGRSFGDYFLSFRHIIIIFVWSPYWVSRHQLQPLTVTLESQRWFIMSLLGEPSLFPYYSQYLFTPHTLLQTYKAKLGPVCLPHFCGRTFQQP